MLRPVVRLRLARWLLIIVSVVKLSLLECRQLSSTLTLGPCAGVVRPVKRGLTRTVEKWTFRELRTRRSSLRGGLKRLIGNDGALRLLRPEITMNLQLVLCSVTSVGTIRLISVNPVRSLTRLLGGLRTSALLWLRNRTPCSCSATLSFLFVWLVW